ncbi:MAG: radical SAM protein [Deltaproteobacteria bacterium]|nr:radical SAM protein [Deltaproteobacteria bacterium]MBW2138476.1 radical SAM protein [Deltaproteobacteria bacterium]
MEKYKYIFGPVPSRRLGRSLGVDLIPYKTCTQDCVFCQLGRTPEKTLARREYVPMGEVLDELGQWLKKDGKADHITLSGSGEPTLHSRFGEVFRFVRKNSTLETVLLTNGSLFYLPEVRKEALQAHIVKISLSAWDQASYRWVNRPHPDLNFKQSIEGQKAFRNEFKGEMWIEVFLVAGMNSIPSDVAKIASLAELLKPDRIHLNTAVRPPAENFVAPLSRERLASLCNLFRPPAEVIAGYKDQGGLETRANEEAIISMLRRRPCTAGDITRAFGMHLNEASKYLGSLLRQGQIRAERAGDSVYFVATMKEQRGPYPRVNTASTSEDSKAEPPTTNRVGTRRLENER